MPLDDNWTGFSPSKRYSGDLPEISRNTSARKGGLKRNRARQGMRGKPRDPWQGGHGPRCIPVEASARRDLSPKRDVAAAKAFFRALLQILRSGVE